MKLDAKIPEGAIADKWTKYKATIPLVNPANKRNIEVIVVGTGLAGAAAAATLGEMGYKVKAFCFQDSPRRAAGSKAAIVARFRHDACIL
jgi:succinate dehydrogenase / fumarate reductase flavoprotein subunit